MKKVKAALLPILLIISMLIAGCVNNKPGKSEHGVKEQEIIGKTQGIENLQLKITVGDTLLIATLIDSKTTRDFIEQLPITITMGDINGREKYSSLSHKLSKEGTVKTTFQKGDIGYWLGGGLAVFYHQDNSIIKAGLIVIARLEKGIEVFGKPGSVTVKLEAVKKN